MPTDTIYRHQQALDPSALTIIAGAAHAVSAAIADCHAVGRNPDADAAVILLARQLGRIADAVPSSDEALRRRCVETITTLRGERFVPPNARLASAPMPDLPRIAA